MTTSPKLCIHRGSDEIGGSCVEIQSSIGERLIIDIGMPLIDDKPAATHLPKIPGIRENDRSIVGILISHMHADHYGLLQYAHDTIPVYMSRFNREALDFASHFVPNTAPCPSARLISEHKPFRVGKSFTVTPYPMNHSAYGGFSFLIETDGKRILYSGDFRGHGRKDNLGDFCKNPPRNINALLLEGTTLSRETNKRFRSEHEIEDAFAEHFRTANALSTVICSGQNIDRLVTIAKAAQKAGKQFVVDFYTAEIIKTTAHKSIVPYFQKYTRVYLPTYQKRVVLKNKEYFIERIKPHYPRRIYLDEYPAAELKHFVFQLSTSTLRDLEKQTPPIPLARPIYSMWDGYWHDSKKMPAQKAFLQKHGYDAPSMIHTSGHACREDLERYVRAAAPAQVIPIHTQVPELYKTIFPSTKLLKNGEWLNMD